MQVFSDPYKATVTKEDGSEVEEDIYEAYNLGLVSAKAALGCGGCWHRGSGYAGP